MTTRHVTIVGGGIAGLATAFYLQRQAQASQQEFRYTLVESDDRLGGKIVTDQVDGFVIEGGPDSFLTQKPWGVQFCVDLGMEEELIPTNDSRRNIFLLQKGNLVPFPGGFTLVPTRFLPFALSPLFSIIGKLRMGMDLFIPPRDDDGDESIGDFIRRRLGKEALDKIGPMMAGIYTGDPSRLSLLSTFPRFADMERKNGSLIKAMRSARKHAPAPPPSSGTRPRTMFTSVRGGMGEVVKRAEAVLTEDLKTGCEASEIRRTESGFEVDLHPGGETLKTDAVVLAVPAFAAARLTRSVSPVLSDRLSQVDYVSSATVSLGYRRTDIAGQHDLDGFGFMVPMSENRKIRACTWTSTKFDHRAPEDSVLLRAFVGGHQDAGAMDLDDTEMVRMVRNEVMQTMGLSAEPAVSRVFRWPNGNPQYDVGHLDRVDDMERLAAEVPGLYLTGSAYRGIGTPDCVKSAVETVAKILGPAT